MNILIADDDKMCRDLLAEHLKSLGDCQFASDGDTLVEAFKLAHSKENPFQLVMIDIMMPGTDGIEALRQIRAYETEQEIPIDLRAKTIMTTALDDRRSITEAFGEEADGYLIKPVEYDSLAKMVEQLGLGSLGLGSLGLNSLGLNSLEG
jgi:two-component system chemotaxis response regulator CheY